MLTTLLTKINWSLVSLRFAILTSTLCAQSAVLTVGMIKDNFDPSSLDQNEPDNVYTVAINEMIKELNITHTIEFVEDISTLEDKVADGSIDVGISNTPNTTPPTQRFMRFMPP